MRNLDRTIIYFIKKSLSYLVVNLTFNRSFEITFDKGFYSYLMKMVNE